MMGCKGYDEGEEEGGLLFQMSPQIHAFLKGTHHRDQDKDKDKEEEEEREGIEEEREDTGKEREKEREKDVVSYRVVRDRWLQMDPLARPSFKDLMTTASIAFPTPKLREKSAELQARLEKLQDAVDRRAYGELVKDVVASKEEQEYFSSYKEQIGFGLHVIVAMFTGYLIGYAFFRSQFPNNMGLHAAGGLLGLVLVMLVESLLFIIQFSKIEKKASKHEKNKTEMGTRFNSQGTKSSVRKVGKHSSTTSIGQQ